MHFTLCAETKHEETDRYTYGGHDEEMQTVFRLEDAIVASCTVSGVDVGQVASCECSDEVADCSIMCQWQTSKVV